MLKNALIICFSTLLLCSGCYTTTADKGKMVWVDPPQPQLSHIAFVEKDNGFFITTDEATKLTNNNDELRAYIRKLEILIDAMKSYYRAK